MLERRTLTLDELEHLTQSFETEEAQRDPFVKLRWQVAGLLHGLALTGLRERDLEPDGAAITVVWNADAEGYDMFTRGLRVACEGQRFGALVAYGPDRLVGMTMLEPLGDA